MAKKEVAAFTTMVNDLGSVDKRRIPEAIRQFINIDERSDFLRAVALGAQLALNDEISLDGFIPDESTPDGQRCTIITDTMEGNDII